MRGRHDVELVEEGAAAEDEDRHVVGVPRHPHLPPERAGKLDIGTRIIKSLNREKDSKATIGSCP